MTYTDEEIGKSEGTSLSPLYFRSREISERFFNEAKEDTFKPIADEVGNMVYASINEKIAEWLLYDTECNLHHEIERAVECEVEAMLTGGALKYLTPDRAYYLRKRIFEKYGDELRDKRIEDLEEEVKRWRN